jgi:hypothetical protein
MKFIKLCCKLYQLAIDFTKGTYFDIVEIYFGIPTSNFYYHGFWKDI